jgi:uncharacterized membrane protein
MNTIFKFWINGWILMALVFGAAFSRFFDSAGDKAQAKPRKRGKARPVWIPWAIGGSLIVVLGLMAAWMDTLTLGRGWRNAPSQIGLALLFLAPLLWAALSPWQPGLAGKSIFAGLFALGLLYPAGATIARIREASQFSDPHLDGMEFMRHRPGRFSSMDRDYDQYDAELIDWLNKNADKTEVLLEAPGIETYKGYSRFAIYTGLPTLLGWEYQVGQQLGSRTGSQLAIRKEDAMRIYTTHDLAEAKALLDRYHIRWIVVGGIERKLFGPGADFEKFGTFCKETLRNSGALLYRYDGSQ